MINLMATAERYYRRLGSRCKIMFLLMILTMMVFVNISPLTSMRRTAKFRQEGINNNLKLSKDKDVNLKNKRDAMLVNTSLCQIPNIDLYDQTIRKYIFKVDDDVKCNKYPRLTYTNGATLYINHQLTSCQHCSNVTCCYTYLFRYEDGRSDNLYRFAPYCKFIRGESVKLVNEYVRVQCFSPQKDKIYINYHAVVLRKKSVERKLKSPKISSNNDYRVLLLGIDSVSRLNFHRNIEKTKKFLVEHLGAIELLGYNKVGLNTFPNMIPLTTGLNVEELLSNCWQINGSFDKCRFLWSNAHERGYKTLLSEDCSWNNTLNYLKEGFYHQPTDYYLRPIMLAAERDISYLDSLDCRLCLGPTTVTEFLLKYTYDYFKTFSEDKLFALIWSNSMTHDYLNWVVKADTYYEKFFRNMSNSGALNRTVVIFLSDHGIRTGDIVMTYVGKMEERLPFAFIYLPQHFRDNHVELVQAIKTNANRLTTPFDVHMTIKHLMQFTSYNMSSSNWFSDDQITSRAQSLLNVVPENRTCKMAGIPMSWCTCHQHNEVDRSDPDVTRAALHVIDWINNKLAEHKVLDKCFKWSLKKIKYASKLQDIAEDEKVGITYLMLSVEAEPGNAIFSASVKMYNNTYGIIGKIDRSDIVGNQSHYTKCLLLKLYCYCKDLIKA